MHYVVFGALVLGLFTGMYIGGFWNEAGHSLETIAEQKKEIRIDAAQDAVTADADTKAVAEDTKVRTVFQTRMEYIIKEVPVEVIREMDSECVVPDQFVSLWNTANKGIAPTSPSETDGEAAADRHTGAETQ